MESIQANQPRSRDEINRILVHVRLLAVLRPFIAKVCTRLVVHQQTRQVGHPVGAIDRKGRRGSR